jgi:hypothetical protein
LGLFNYLFWNGSLFGYFYPGERHCDFLVFAAVADFLAARRIVEEKSSEEDVIEGNANARSCQDYQKGAVSIQSLYF